MPHFQTIWTKGFLRPRLQANGHTQRKIDEDDALIRLCEATAMECPDLSILTIRSSVHATTYNRVRSRERVPSVPHVTASFCHGPTNIQHPSHIIVSNYRGFNSYWPGVDRREVTWGLLGQGPTYPGFVFKGVPNSLQQTTIEE